MRIQAKDKKDAWVKAQIIMGCGLLLYSDNQTYKTYKPDDSKKFEDGYVNEYDDELELVLADGDSIEIFFEKEPPKDEKNRIIDDLENQIESLKEENKELREDIKTLKGRLTIAEREREQNKTLRKLMFTYSKLAEDVEKFLDSAAEFREFTEKIKALKSHLGTEGEEK